MAYLLATLKWLFARIVGGWLLKKGKHLWEKYLNNPESKLYHLTLKKNVKHIWMMFKIYAFINFILLLSKVCLGRNISKETTFKLLAFLILVVLAIVVIPMWQRRERLRKEAEPVLF